MEAALGLNHKEVFCKQLGLLTLVVVVVVVLLTQQLHITTELLAVQAYALSSIGAHYNGTLCKD
jgi:hypothetical protein